MRVLILQWIICQALVHIIDIFIFQEEISIVEQQRSIIIFFENQDEVLSVHREAQRTTVIITRQIHLSKSRR